MAEYLFEAEKITKLYAGSAALNGVDIRIAPGEILGLVGENGAGKSTLLKIMIGAESPTDGLMRAGGEPYLPSSPLDANRIGIGMVFQEQSLIRNLTVAQNIFFGQESDYCRVGVINKKRMLRDAKEILDELGLSSIDPGARVETLNFAVRQMVEIAKVFHIVKRNNTSNAIILLDEPTSVLSESETESLFANLRKLRSEEGISVIFVSHRLDEVLEITDRIYVFKNGEKVCEVASREATEELLYEQMVGKSATGDYYKENLQVQTSDRTLLEVRDLGLRGYFKHVDFALHEGEVLGICGVVGSGKEKLCGVICGDERHTSGTIVVDGKERIFAAPHNALAANILAIPKERREEGIIGDASITENIALSNLRAVTRKGAISKRKQSELAEKWIGELSVKCSSPRQKIAFLSGGNAQKVVFGRILSSDARVLVLNHPTRGVDVGAKEEIYLLIRKITAEGRGVILLGDTLDECIGLSSRILIMKDGLIQKSRDAAAREKPEQVDIVRYMM